jgi:hypothetical protein
MTATLSDFTVSRDFNIQEVEKCLRTHGAAVLPAWLGDSELTFLRQEFDDAIADSDERYAYQIKYEPGHAVSMMRDRLPADKYRGINRIFNSKKMVELTQRYMGSQHLLNYEVYATHEHRPGVDVAPTHFDKLWTLKYMIYLTDNTSQNAAFGVVPGSAPSNREKFRKIYTENNIRRLSMDDERYQEMENKSSDEAEVVDIVGPAGTLVIFDSDVFHHAGQVSAGMERKILRGHSGPAINYVSVRKGSQQWWRGERAFTKLDIFKDRIMNCFS